MREIKFRGVSTYNNEFWTGYLLVSKYTGKTFIVQNALESHDHQFTGGYSFAHFTEIIPETAGQYTGLKDKNGKDIYEGDILKHHGIVFWDDDFMRWGAIDLNWNDRREKHELNYLTSDFIIIGNIHENPELLKTN